MGLKKNKVIWAEIGTVHTKREGKQKKRTGEWGNELAGYLTLQLHAQETLWNTKVGWWMVNSLRKVGYTQMHPSCRMNYSSPTVCTAFGKQQKDFKAGFERRADEYLDKRCRENEQQKKKKESSGLQTQTQPSVIGMKGRGKRNLLSQCPKLFIFSLTCDWCNTENRKTANMCRWCKNSKGTAKLWQWRKKTKCNRHTSSGSQTFFRQTDVESTRGISIISLNAKHLRIPHTRPDSQLCISFMRFIDDKQGH